MHFQEYLLLRNKLFFLLYMESIYLTDNKYYISELCFSLNRTGMKKEKFDFLLIFMTLGVVAFLLSSCSKDDESNNNTDQGSSVFNVSLKSTSSKSTYEAVNIDIQSVSIHTSTDSASTTGWFDLETNTGIFDLLDYEAGNDTLIAFDSVLQTQTVSQIRLILGENNTVVDDGETYDLDTPSAQTSGLKIQIHAELQADASYKIVLDFDADESIKNTGNGKFKLQPVIQATVIEQ